MAIRRTVPAMVSEFGRREIDWPPMVQQAERIVEDQTHSATVHLSNEWTVKDHANPLVSNLRENANVLIKVDELRPSGLITGSPPAKSESNPFKIAV